MKATKKIELTIEIADIEDWDDYFTSAQYITDNIKEHLLRDNDKVKVIINTERLILNK